MSHWIGTSNVAAAQVRNETVILPSMALSLDPEGHLEPLQPGNRFVGLSKDTRQKDSAILSVAFYFEGVTEMAIPDVSATDLGKVVYATGPHSFTISTKEKPSSPIGHVVGCNIKGRCEVKFYTTKL